MTELTRLWMDLSQVNPTATTENSAKNTYNRATQLLQKLKGENVQVTSLCLNALALLQINHPNPSGEERQQAPKILAASVAHAEVLGDVLSLMLSNNLMATCMPEKANVCARLFLLFVRVDFLSSTSFA